MMRKQAMSVTDAAALRIQALLANRGKPSAGVRIGVRARGCSGLSYTLEYADEKGKFDEVVEDKGVTILVDPKAVMFILGTEMDWVEDKMQSGFTFTNPNEKVLQTADDWDDMHRSQRFDMLPDRACASVLGELFSKPLLEAERRLVEPWRPTVVLWCCACSCRPRRRGLDGPFLRPC